MAKSDIDNNTVKRQDGQISFEGGMNWIDAPNELQENESRFIVNCDIRRKDLEKAKGQRAFAEVEIGAEFYDRFFTDNLSATKWAAFVTDDNVISVNDDFKLQAVVATAATATGVISTRVSPIATNSYMEFELTTTSTQGGSNALRVALNANATAVTSGVGVALLFNSDGTISTEVDGTPTATSAVWIVDTRYRVRIEKQSTGWTFCFVRLTTTVNSTTFVAIDPNTQSAVTIGTVTSEGSVPSYLMFQPSLGTWLFDDVTYHEGFSDAITKIPATGIVRFYREFTENETIVFAFGNMYKYTDTNGFVLLSSGFSLTARWTFRIFNDTLFATNGVDRPIRYDGFNVFPVGSGDNQAPVASYIEVHLQSLFLAEGNSVFRNSPGNTETWTDLIPLTDVDAWKGDIIAGLVKLGSSIFVIKTASVWEISGTLTNNFVLRRVPGTRGCIAPYSIANDGKRVFFRGIDGVYLFDGLRTQLVSYKIHPAFNRNVKSPFETTLFGKASDSVGIIHDFKYRLSVVQNGEADVEFNNYEYVYDFAVNGTSGAWYARDRRNIAMYSSWDGDGDENELVTIPSDTSNILFELEVEDGNTRSNYTCVTIKRIADTPFVGQWQSRNLIARNLARDFLEKTWSPLRVHYAPAGEWHLGIRMTTMNNLPSQLRTFPQTYLKNNSAFTAKLSGGIGYTGPTLLANVDADTVNTNAFYLNDVKSILLSSFLEDEFISNPRTESDAVTDVSNKMGNANRGIECVLTLNQDQEVRTASGFTGTSAPTSLRKALGNFEPFRITRVFVGLQEEARRGTG